MLSGLKVFKLCFFLGKGYHINIMSYCNLILISFVLLFWLIKFIWYDDESRKKNFVMLRCPMFKFLE
jgi:hypothetical protein